MSALAMQRAALATLLVLALPVRGQVWVMAPNSLVEKFRESNGSIVGATATFGAPFYGERVLGQVVMPNTKTHSWWCNKDDYELQQGTARVMKEGEQVKLITILLVQRGGDCPITTKVKVAREKGAHAVIVVDKDDSTFTSKDMPHVIVRNSAGEDDDQLIPSVLISKEDGKSLIDAVRSEPAVVVELKWNVPVNHVVSADLWMSSASKESLLFLKEFAKRRRVLKGVVAFQPHYSVFTMDTSDVSTLNELCFESNKKFCTEDPDGPGPIKGRDVVRENVRQLCIHETYKSVQNVVPETGDKVHYAEKYWDYMEMFDRCLGQFGDECSKKIMEALHMDTAAIEKCVTSSGEEKLQSELEHRAWSPRALRINGWRYSGQMSADLVTRAICAGFIYQPIECTTLLEKRDPFNPYVPPEKNQGVSLRTLFMWLVATCLLVFLLLALYRRYLQKDLRAQLKEEVMLEVQTAMGNYKQMANA